MKLSLCQACFLVLLDCTSGNHRPFSPVIGVLTQPWAPRSKLPPNLPTNGSYIVASYVKWLEATGARVVPLSYDMPLSKLDDTLSKLNGVLFPGGGCNISKGSPYGDFSIHVFNYALSNSMPVHGTCLGFEQLLEYTGASLTDFDASGITLPLDFGPGAFNETILSDWPQSLRDTASTRPVTVNMHHKGVGIEAFNKNVRLTGFWNMLATSVDRNGNAFVTMAEGREHPVFITQFHPEKNIFEFAEPYDSPTGDGSSEAHSADAIQISQRLATAFVTAAREGERGFEFSKDELDAAIIYKWSPVFVEPELPEISFEQVYFFPPSTPSVEAGSASTDTLLI